MICLFKGFRKIRDKLLKFSYWVDGDIRISLYSPVIKGIIRICRFEKGGKHLNALGFFLCSAQGFFRKKIRSYQEHI
ncbi:MAG: hypothetical protein DWP94_07505 [Flavobacterium sp.]|nr:MAG: hypothetical protein DWP94_07505 [Flavobacterium sp.]